MISLSIFRSLPFGVICLRYARNEFCVVHVRHLMCQDMNRQHCRLVDAASSEMALKVEHTKQFCLFHWVIHLEFGRFPDPFPPVTMFGINMPIKDSHPLHPLTSSFFDRYVYNKNFRSCLKSPCSQTLFRHFAP